MQKRPNIERVLRAQTLVICILLAGCSGSQQLEQLGQSAAVLQPPPWASVEIATAKKVILSKRQRISKEPETIRHSMIGHPHGCVEIRPVESRLVKQPATCVCVDVYSRIASANNFGKQRVLAVFWQDGAVEFNNSGIAAYQNYCGGLTAFF